jgi:hypothetical protein
VGFGHLRKRISSKAGYVILHVSEEAQKIKQGLQNKTAWTWARAHVFDYCYQNPEMVICMSRKNEYEAKRRTFLGNWLNK